MQCDVELETVRNLYRFCARCAACGRQSALDIGRIRLRAYHGRTEGVTLGGLRDRLRCQSCHSRRVSLRLELTPRD